MKHHEDPRDLAYDVLCHVEERDAYADKALDAVLSSRPDLDVRDRGLATELVYGVLRKRGTLDLCLQPHLRRPLDRLDPEILRILRLGAYQILFLDRVPDHAAVNVSVEMAKHMARPGTASLVNACLRSLCRQKAGRDKAGEHLDMTEAGAPKWLEDLWTAELGEERARGLFRSLVQVPETWLRSNTIMTGADALVDSLGEDGFVVEAAQDLPGALLVREGGDLRRARAFSLGWFVQQDAASQVAVRLLDPQPGDRVLDLCSAPGIKTTQIAERMRNQGLIVAADINLSRLHELSLLCRRMGISITRPVCADAGRPEHSCLGRHPFARILVDAPCSGLGILRRNPERKWRPAPDFDGLRKLQKRMLRHAASLIRNGGVLVYSTCTVSRRENEGLVEWFLKGNRNFVSEDAAPFLPERFRGSLSGQGYFCSWLGDVSSDLFFAARLRRMA